MKFKSIIRSIHEREFIIEMYKPNFFLAGAALGLVVLGESEKNIAISITLLFTLTKGQKLMYKVIESSMYKLEFSHNC